MLTLIATAVPPWELEAAAKTSHFDIHVRPARARAKQNAPGRSPVSWRSSGRSARVVGAFCAISGPFRGYSITPQVAGTCPGAF
jgi:hypothetical protein